MKKRGKISTSLIVLTTIGILLTAVAVFTITYQQLNGITETAIHGDLTDMIARMESEVDNFLTEAENVTNHMSSFDEFAAAVEKKDPEAIKVAIEDFKNYTEVDTDNITVTDEKGIVLLRCFSDSAGDDVSGYSYAKDALNGKSSTAVCQSAVMPLAARSCYPVKNADGKVIGILSVSYDLGDTAVLDAVKGDSENEFTIYNNNTRYNTTLMQNGSRMIGTEMPDNIKSTVLDNKSTYTGKTVVNGLNYECIFHPLIDNEGKAVGAIAVNISTEDIISKRMSALIAIIIVMIVIAALVVVATTLYTKKTIVGPVGQLAKAAENMSNGNLSVEITYIPNNEIGTLAESIKQTITNMKMYIDDISHHTSNIADGDITQHITNDYVGDFSSIKESINKLIRHLNKTFSSISEAADQVNSGANEVANAAQSLSQSSTTQASSIQELSASIMSISDQVKENARNVDIAGNYVQESKNGIENSNEYMNHMVTAMNEINESSVEISKIIKVIDDIAFQTNILALNAAVEAARAGAAGKGFSVVADEVRNLAGKSAEAAKQTTRLIETSVSSAEKGNQIVKETAAALESVKEQSNMVVETIKKIQLASNQQAEDISQVSISVDQISSVVQTNSATSQESAAASQELSGQAQMLKDELGQFKLSNDIDSFSSYNNTSGDSSMYLSPKPSYVDIEEEQKSKTVSAPRPSAPAPVSRPAPRPSAPVMDDSPITIDLDDDKY